MNCTNSVFFIPIAAFALFIGVDLLLAGRGRDSNIS
jgi:hypothetical protein